MTHHNLIMALKNLQDSIKNIVPFDFNPGNLLIFDFTASNQELRKIDMTNTSEFSQYIFNKMKQNNVRFAIGRYNEDRTIYARSSLFKGETQPRTVHLGIDLWAEPGTPLFAPLPCKVHSFRNNNLFGDYGPTIILEHNLLGITFYTLYGHLSLESLNQIYIGQTFNAGDWIASIGNFPTNGNWPAHLHFQIITDMQGREGDFPGICSLQDRQMFLELCPDPNLILNIKNL